MHHRAVRTLALAIAFAIAFSLLAGAQAQSGDAAGVAGTWEGQIDTPPPLGVIVRIDHDEGALSGTVDIPAQGASGLPLDAIEVDGDAVRFGIADVPGSPTFDGTRDGDRIAGTFSQGGTDFAFTLERTCEGAAAAGPEAAPSEAADVYEDPAGVFTVPVPTGWAVEEGDGFTTLLSPEGGIRLHLLALDEDDPEAAVERAWAVADAEFDVPVDNALDAPSDPGIERTRVVNYDSPSGELHQAVAQLHEGVSHVMLVDADIAAAQRRSSQVNIVLSGYRVLALEELDLTGVAPRPVPEVVDVLEPFIDQALQAFGIPGAVVAIVQDDEVAYTSGFGVRGDGGEALTADTHMMIGSTGKTLTTLLMAAMVDDGRFAWDTPVVEVLPEFEVADAELTESMTMWNLVCACSGVPRRDFELLFNADGMTAEDVVESLATFEFFTDFGEAFQYSNQLVGTGGFAAAAADGAAWGELGQGYADALERRVLEPIGMPHTTLSFERVIERGAHALPHQLDLDSGGYLEVPLHVERLLAPIAPAGAHWSTAEDMARFMLTQLSTGVAPDGTRIASEENVRATWEPRVPMSATASYGLGWMVDEYYGLRSLSHGGNTLGFTSEFAFLPETGVGILILANAQGANAFTGAVRERLFELVFEQPARSEEQVVLEVERLDQMLADIQDRLGSEVAEDVVTPYLGTFESPELGTISLALEDGVLTLDAGEFRTPLRPSVDGDGEVDGYVAMEGPIATASFTFTEVEGEPVIVFGEGAVSYTFVRVP